MKARKALVVICWKAKPESGDKRVLMLKVQPSRGAFWQPVTGGVEKSESFAEGALREAEEETGFQFEHFPQYLGMEYEFTGTRGEVLERAFFLPMYSDEPPAPTLDPREHSEFQWMSPEEAQAIAKFPSNKEAIRRSTGPSPLLFLSKQGQFFQDGEEVTHARTAALLHKSLTKKPSGIFTVKIGAEEIDVVVEDSPRFVRSYDRKTGSIFLSDTSEETLRPETLVASDAPSLYCELKNGWKARFLSPAYYEIAKDIREELDGEYLLHFLGRDYRLAVSH
jgi:8-oxo-dGTP pyrophosphatase MutT (NUDIX family)